MLQLTTCWLIFWLNTLVIFLKVCKNCWPQATGRYVLRYGFGTTSAWLPSLALGQSSQMISLFQHFLPVHGYSFLKSTFQMISRHTWPQAYLHFKWSAVMLNLPSEILHLLHGCWCYCTSEQISGINIATSSPSSCNICFIIIYLGYFIFGIITIYCFTHISHHTTPHVVVVGYFNFYKWISSIWYSLFP